MFWEEDMLSKLKNPWHKFMIASVVLSVLIFILPPLYGEGYDAILDIYNGDATNMTVGSLFYEYKDKCSVHNSFRGVIYMHSF